MTVLAGLQEKIGGLFGPTSPEEQQRQALARKLNDEADYYAAVIIKKLTQLGLCYRYPKSQQDFLNKGVQQVKFTKAVGTPEAIYLMIDTLRLPRRIKLADLKDEDVLDDLAVVCGRPVRFKHDSRSGAWFIIERQSGVWGVPKKLGFEDALEHWPDSSRKKLLLPMGVGENRKLHYRGLASMPHALVGGATGTGKTTMLHAWITALILKNSPKALRLALVDLKGGVEFTRYKKLPHMLDADFTDDEDVTGFVKRPDDVIPTLRWMRNEMDRRLNLFEKAGGIQNLAIWNYRRYPLPRLVLVVDELASLMLDPDLKKEAKKLLADITARGRAPGVHTILATQRPDTGVIDGQIKGNIDARCAFRVPDNASSMVILDTTEAARFPENTPPGRFIYRRGMDKMEVQAPWVTPGQIRQVIKGVLDGGTDDDDMKNLPPEEIFRFSVEQLNGSFSYRKLYDALSGKASQQYLRKLGSEYEGEVIEINEMLYEMKPAEGRKPRMLVPIGLHDSESHAAQRITHKNEPKNPSKRG
jgi:DNA polymerase III delta prime subunit